MFLLLILVFVAAADGVERLLERFGVVTRAFYIVTVLGLVGGAPWGERTLRKFLVSYS